MSIFFPLSKSIAEVNHIAKQTEKEKDAEIEILPSKIVNPPNHLFRKKTISCNNITSFLNKKKSYSIQILNKIEKQEEVAKV